MSLEDVDMNGGYVNSRTRCTDDEGFFDDDAVVCATDEQLDGSSAHSSSSRGQREKLLPRYKLADNLKDTIDGLRNDILPAPIFKTISQGCMALIPYTPPVNILQVTKAKDTDDSTEMCESMMLMNHQVDASSSSGDGVSEEEIMLY